LELVKSGVNVHAAAIEVGITAEALLTRARAAGRVNHVKKYQCKINSTNLRVNYLSLQLASVSKKCGGFCVEYHKVKYFEKGFTGIETNQVSRLILVPTAPAARAYNKLMNGLPQIDGTIEAACLPEPQLRRRISPYMPTGSIPPPARADC